MVLVGAQNSDLPLAPPHHCQKTCLLGTKLHSSQLGNTMLEAHQAALQAALQREDDCKRTQEYDHLTMWEEQSVAHTQKKVESRQR